MVNTPCFDGPKVAFKRPILRQEPSSGAGPRRMRTPRNADAFANANANSCGFFRKRFAIGA